VNFVRGGPRSAPTGIPTKHQFSKLIQRVYLYHGWSHTWTPIHTLAAFIARKSEIDTILARLTALSSEYFGREPDAVTWGDVGTLASIGADNDFDRAGMPAYRRGVR
jgi:hypothetical protein